MSYTRYSIFLGVFCSFWFSLQGNAQQHPKEGWPEVTVTSKPWTRWWWMGNAVDKAGLKKNLIAIHDVGLGGVEITPIYGVKGEEDNFTDFLSPKWMEMLSYTIHVADSLGLKVDMTLGTGWPYGGSQVTREDAATKIVVQKYDIAKGSKFNETIVVDTAKEKQPASLLYVLAYGDKGDYKDLTSQLKNGNTLKWKAKRQNYTLYAVFTGKTGQKVKRAAPGGEGFTLDHYSVEALHNYVKPYDEAFGKISEHIRAVFNDSYEVYGTDFTPKFFDEFEKRRGYDLKPFVQQLLDTTSTEVGDRIKCDYRETISDLLLDFDNSWTNWAHDGGYITRLQAHGSPGNLIDLYAAADIPECETFGSMPFDIPGLRRLLENIREGDADPAMLKFSSSAAHLSGKPLISSESFTWLRDHFKTALSQCKPEAEELLINGVNHMFLHGSTYSPERAKWPGWKFYASVNFNYNNTIWEDASSLFSYIQSCQSMLQQGNTANETLLYFPVYDTWQKTMKANLLFQFTIHADGWLQETEFYKTTRELLAKGYGVDYISDSFLDKAKVHNGQIVLPGGKYKSLVVPVCSYMPLKTVQNLMRLKHNGAHIIFKGLPESVPGYYNYEAQNKELKALLADNHIKAIENIYPELNEAGAFAEELVSTGLKYTSRVTRDGEKIYFLVNHTPNLIDGMIPVNTTAEEVVLYNPLTKAYGKAYTVKGIHSTKVKLYIKPGESILLKAGKKSDTKDWIYLKPGIQEFPITADWKLTFKTGGPELPKGEVIKELTSWTTFGKEAEAFSGTATYETTFENVMETPYWMLDLGDVRESAKVWVNGEYVGCAWANPYQLQVNNLKKGTNTLKIEVTNLPANRVRDMEKRGEEWKIFYEINIVNKDYKKFDASVWEPMPSGLLGAVKFIPLQKELN